MAGIATSNLTLITDCEAATGWIGSTATILVDTFNLLEIPV